jgi:hypothetical protein
MMRMATKAIVVAAMTASLAAAGSGAARPETPEQQPGAIAAAPVTRDGWWIRVNPANHANNLSWRFGAARNRLGTPQRWWKDQTQLEFDLPAAERGLKVLHLAAIGLPYKDAVSFCLFFQDHGVELFEFTNEKIAQVDQAMQDAACVP